MTVYLKFKVIVLRPFPVRWAFQMKARYRRLRIYRCLKVKTMGMGEQYSYVKFGLLILQ